MEDKTLAIVADLKSRGIVKWEDPDFGGPSALFANAAKPTV